MRIRVVCTALIALLSIGVHPARALDSTELVIQRTEWPVIANSSNIGALPQVRQVLSRFDESGRYRIVVRYPGGEAGTEWAQQLVRWFVAHGVPGDFIGRELGAGGADRLLLLLIES